MKRPKLEIVPATKADIEEVSGDKPVIPHRMYVYAGKAGGEVLGVGGYAIERDTGAAILFLDRKKGVGDDYKMALPRLALRLILEMKDRGFKQIVALCDKDIDRAEEFLLWLGFRQRGEVYVYEGD
jgi:hypothetical protein